ncbi:hypothetical protein [uncultured Oscillibacter sp.]|jgi:hypothetical protein|uniref:hypothetical protein n=1 Tax=uncultured Oscillibacter sp. TaxID=876091 RepID=UPI0025EEEA52|nr:hypothetical protein [uncultured Oscillibacter sp.]
MDKKKNWIQGFTLVLCLFLLVLNLWQLRQISDLRRQLQSTETNLQMETRRLDERVQAVQRAAQEADKLVQDWELQSVDVDPASRCLRAEVSLGLKEWREDTQVYLTVTQGTETRNALLTGNGGRYSGVVEIPVDSREIRMLARISAEGLQKEEDLSGWDSASMLLPVQCYGWGVGGPNYARNPDKTGALTVTHCEAELMGYEKRALPQLSEQVFRLRRNGEIAVEKTAMYGETINQYTCEEVSSEAQIGDELILTFFCRDESGLGYEFFLDCWAIDDNGIGARRAPAADWPRLTWD